MYNTEEWSPQQTDNLNQQKHHCVDLNLFVAATTLVVELVR